MSYINSSKPIDMSIFNAIGFEDTIRLKEIKPMTEDWMKEREFRNQREMNLLTSKGQIVANEGNLNYNIVNLEKHNKFVRLLYYILFDRQTFKRRIKEILKK